ncbi:putative signal transduction protein [Thermodesulfobium narugense DSM 14796]|uniref:Putative signal transduction protein n=1 Tax=Thermodesulfobium narugense DSM 14796 TaxID=747365 RepID=M1E7L4_9BACT|nr:HDOD domain-containing protein [Thermodesulfobium narugense]AEE15311.1 putative signal transduction protein [Thermodesulfobium narugense DSM 14796]
MSFITRIPIFKKNLELFGYEIKGFYEGSFMSCLEECLNTIGLNVLSKEKYLFLNVPPEIFEFDNLRDMIPPKKAIFIVNPSQISNKEIFKKLKNQGIMLCANVSDLSNLEEVKNFDYVKISVSSFQGDWTKIPSIFNGGKLLVEVNEKPIFNKAVTSGYELFEGDFFIQPEIIARKELSPQKAIILSILQDVRQKDFDFSKIEEKIKKDPYLTIKLLKFINSAFFSFKTTITSIRQALVILGQQEFVRWLTLVILGKLNEGKPEEIVYRASERARFMELISNYVGLYERSQEAFLVGLFSLAPAMTDISMEEFIKEVPVTDDVKASLLGNGIFTDLFNLRLSIENANWMEMKKISEKLGINPNKIEIIIYESIKWAHESLLYIEKT